MQQIITLEKCMYVCMYILAYMHLHIYMYTLEEYASNGGKNKFPEQCSFSTVLQRIKSRYNATKRYV